MNSTVRFWLSAAIMTAAMVLPASSAFSQTSSVAITAAEGAQPLTISVVDEATQEELGQVVFPDLPANETLRAGRLQALPNALANRPAESFLHGNPNADPEPSPTSEPRDIKTFLGCWDG